MPELYVTADGLTTENSPADMGRRVFSAVRDYADKHCGTVLGESDLKDVDSGALAYEVLTDFLVDFMHLVQSAGVDAEELVASSMRHFEPERDSVPA